MPCPAEKTDWHFELLVTLAEQGARKLLRKTANQQAWRAGFRDDAWSAEVARRIKAAKETATSRAVSRALKEVASR